MKPSDALATRIRGLRRLRCWSQEHLAGAANITARTVQRVEEGRRVSGETLLAIAAAFGISAEELVAAAPGESSEDAARSNHNPPSPDFVAVVFSDIQGSVPLWERDPETMRAALTEHHRTIRSAIADFTGYEAKTEGDCFMIVLADAATALDLCLAVQAALLAADWPAELRENPEAADVYDGTGALMLRGLRVRMGVHVGHAWAEIDPTTGRTDYFGPTVNRAARVMQSAHGGQVLVTREAWTAAEGRARACCLELGPVRLRGFGQPFQLLQAYPASSVPRSFPPPTADGGVPTNLAPARTYFVGREAELHGIASALEGEARLLTLLGPAGVGKSRLAIALAAKSFEIYPGGVWLVELARATTLETILDAIACALEVSFTGRLSTESRLDALGAALGPNRGCLLILDNLEHVVPLVRSVIERLLTLCPCLRVLATSQHRLSAHGEHVHALGGLPISDAAELFARRARAVDQRFDLDEHNTPLVETLVERLEGNPLAIELAAARTKILRPGEILERLNARLDFLTSMPCPGVLARHTTLRAALEWSFSLLTSEERNAIASLSHLPSDFDIDVAEALLEPSEGGSSGSALDLVQSLLEKSLLGTHDARDPLSETRLYVYESVRDFARELSAISIATGLSRWATTVGRAQIEEWHRAPSARLLGRIQRNMPIYRGALASALLSDVVRAVEIYDLIEGVLVREPGVTSSRYTEILGPDIRDRLVDATQSNPDLHWRALRGRVRLRLNGPQLDLVEADLYRMEAVGAPQFVTLGLRSLVSEHRFDYEQSWKQATLALSLVPESEVAHRFWCIATLALLAVFREMGPVGAARRHVDELLALAPRVPTRAFDALLCSASLELRGGNAEEAVRSCEKLLRLARQQGSHHVIEATALLGSAYYCLGRLDEAEHQLRTAREAARAHGDKSSEVYYLEMLGSLACCRRMDADASVLWTEGAQLRHLNPGRAFACEVKLAFLATLTDGASTSRLRELAARPESARPDTARILNILLAAEAAARGDAPTVRASSANTKDVLVSILADVAVARSASSTFAPDAAEGAARAQQRLVEVPRVGDDAFLARLVEHSVTDLVDSMRHVTSSP